MSIFSVNHEDVSNREWNWNYKRNVPVKSKPHQLHQSPALHSEIKIVLLFWNKEERCFHFNPLGDHNAFLSWAEGLWRDWRHRWFGIHDSECWKPFRMHFISQWRLPYLLSLLRFWCLLENVLVFLGKASICQKLLLKINITEMFASCGASFVNMPKA